MSEAEALFSGDAGALRDAGRPVARVSRRPRVGIVSFLAGFLLIALAYAHWRDFIYPHYLGGVVFQCAALALPLVWALTRTREDLTRTHRRWPDIALTAYGLFLAATCLWAPSRRLAAIGSLPILFHVFWARGLGQLLQTRADVRFILRAYFVAGALAAALGIYAVLHAGTAQAVHEVLGHRNFLAIFLLPPLLIGLCDGLAPEIAPGARRGGLTGFPLWAVASCAAVMLAALALCTSLASGIGLGAGVLCLLAARLGRRGRWAMVLAAAALVVVIAAILAAPAVQRWLIERHAPQATRWFLWQGALKMIAARPLAGWGTGMFLLHFADFKPTLPMKHGLLLNITLHPHNEFLMVAAEGGLIALLLYLLALGLAARDHLAATERQERPLDRLTGWAALAGFAAMSVHGLFEVALRYWAPGAAYWTLIGLMVAFPQADGERQTRSLRGGTIVGILRLAAVLVLVAVPLVGVVWNGAKAEWLMAGGQRSARSVEEREARLTEAERRSRYVPDYLLALRDQAHHLERSGRPDAAISVYERLEQTAPGYGAARRSLGALLFHRATEVGPADAEAGRALLVRAADVLRQAVRQNPYDVAARLTLARALMTASSRNLPQALEHVRAALDADPSNPLVLFRYAVLLAEAGRKEDAIAHLDRAAGFCGPDQAALREDIRRLQEKLGPG